jgi:hypothetical protein
MNFETIGLKSRYVFKETHLDTSHEIDDIRAKLRRFVAPAIRDLESQKLINGFHYIVHASIDLRISSSDWAQQLPGIRGVLADHSISPDLQDWKDADAMPPARYGGSDGVLLCYNNLEFNSRLCLALIELMSETDSDDVREAQEKLCPHQWLHYLCNQFGCLNLDQIGFELKDASDWLAAEKRRARGPQAGAAIDDLLTGLGVVIKQFAVLRNRDFTW